MFSKILIYGVHHSRSSSFARLLPLTRGGGGGGGSGGGGGTEGSHLEKCILFKL